ncbi:MAG: molybdopterin-dependent oxidoreductase [Chloroflexota bacterium]|nr:molybdopterin-dependent oxidoreductase [Chloroflexota bacterium]
MAPKERVELIVNGEARQLDLDPATPLLYVLRGDLGLKGAKYGCGLEQCGACKVLVDGADLPSCQLPVSRVAGLRVATVEGLGSPERLHPLQAAFIEEGAAQCGFCTAGMIVAAQGLLNRVRYPSDQEIRAALATNLCRCGVYDRVRRAIKLRAGGPEPQPIYETVAAPPLPEAATDSEAPPSLRSQPDLDAWLRVNDDETVTVFSGKVELGQGIKTALAQIAADELDLAMERIRLVTADTARTPDEGGTTGSRSLETSGLAIRLAAAEARSHMLSLAFEELESLTPAEDLGVQDGVITDKRSGRQTSYWELMAGRRFARRISAGRSSKAHSQHQHVGAPAQRVDLLAKVTGGAAYVHDLELPGMVHARVLRPPNYHAELADIDIAEIQALPGVVAVVGDGRFLAVIAEREDQALRAHDKAREIATWRDAGALPPPERIYEDLLAKPAQTVEILDGVAQDDLYVKRDMGAEPAPAHQATYYRPFQMHASLGPSAALALWQDDELSVWSHSQAPFVLRDALAQVLDLDREAIRVIHAEGAGCYGHNGADDVALDAALTARALPGRPVLMKWSRADEHAWEPYGSAMVMKLGADLTQSGDIARWRGDIWSYAHSTRPAVGLETSGLLASWHLAAPFAPQKPQPMGGYHSGAHRNADPIYSLPDTRILRHAVADSPLRVSALRSLGAYANVFAIESFMDELARAAGSDPLEFRLRHLSDARARAVLLAAAEKAGWHSRNEERVQGQGWGMALAQYKNLQTYCAIIVKLQVERGSGDLRFRRVIIAADAGQVVNPDGLSNQLEGGFVQAASWTLFESVQFDADGITSLDWESYPILTFESAPVIETLILNRPEMPMLGAGEAAQNPSPAAIANAIYDATGLRLREIPFRPDRIRSQAAP